MHRDIYEAIEKIKNIKNILYKPLMLTIKNKKKFEMRCYEIAFIDLLIEKLSNECGIDSTPENILYFLEVCLYVQLKYFSNNLKRCLIISSWINVIQTIEMGVSE